MKVNSIADPFAKVATDAPVKAATAPEKEKESVERRRVEGNREEMKNVRESRKPEETKRIITHKE